MISLAHKVIADDKGDSDDARFPPLSKNVKFMSIIERAVKAGKFCFYPSDQEDQVKVHIRQLQNTVKVDKVGDMLACGEHSP